MIKFFRHIRRSLIEKNQMRKYFKYAIGEIILVMIGILLALQVNNWNENRKNKIESDNALIELKTEIDDIKTFIKERNSLNLQVTDVMRQYLEEKNTNPSDSIRKETVSKMFYYSPIQCSFPTIEREIGPNHKLIGYDNLINKLRGFKSLYITAEQSRFYLDEYWNRNVITFQKEQGLMLSFVSSIGLIDKYVKGLEALYDNETFKDIISMEFLYLKSYADLNTELHEYLVGLEEQVDEHIKN